MDYWYWEKQQEAYPTEQYANYKQLCEEEHVINNYETVYLLPITCRKEPLTIHELTMQYLEQVPQRNMQDTLILSAEITNSNYRSYNKFKLGQVNGKLAVSNKEPL